MIESEVDLVQRARAGDRAAFEELVRRTSRLVFTRLYVETGCVHQSEDLLQETMLQAYRSLHRLAEPAAFRPWLLTISHNVLIDAARRDARQKRSTPSTSNPLAAMPASGPPPDEAAHREETRQRVLIALRSLPEEYRMPLALRFLTGSDYGAISEQLGLTNGSLRGFLHRGLKMLRERLPPELAGGING
jgi:RNA polymerase sigma-70 factor (ECF subfamily)